MSSYIGKYIVNIKSKKKFGPITNQSVNRFYHPDGFALKSREGKTWKINNDNSSYIGKYIVNIESKKKFGPITNQSENRFYHPDGFAYKAREGITWKIVNNVNNKKNNLLKCNEKLLCKICYENEVNQVLKCGHILCKSCVDRFPLYFLCPFCKEHISKSNNVKKIIF